MFPVLAERHRRRESLQCTVPRLFCWNCQKRTNTQQWAKSYWLCRLRGFLLTTCCTFNKGALRVMSAPHSSNIPNFSFKVLGPSWADVSCVFWCWAWAQPKAIDDSLKEVHPNKDQSCLVQNFCLTAFACRLPRSISHAKSQSDWHSAFWIHVLRRWMCISPQIPALPSWWTGPMYEKGAKRLSLNSMKLSAAQK